MTIGGQGDDSGFYINLAQGTLVLAKQNSQRPCRLTGQQR